MNCHHPTRWVWNKKTVQEIIDFAVYKLSASHTVGLELNRTELISLEREIELSPSHAAGLEHTGEIYEEIDRILFMSPSHPVGSERISTCSYFGVLSLCVSIPHCGLGRWRA